MASVIRALCSPQMARLFRLPPHQGRLGVRRFIVPPRDSLGGVKLLVPQESRSIAWQRGIHRFMHLWSSAVNSQIVVQSHPIGWRFRLLNYSLLG